ncbi:MAG: proton-conducting transporter membrane subunit, partial [Ignisphaera sp.]
VSAALLGISRYGKKFLDSVAVSMAILGLAMSIALMLNSYRNSVEVYTFGGFRPPLGIVYYADFINSILSLLSSFATIISIVVAYITMDYNTRKYFYPLAFLLATGAQGFIFSGDLFHLYVSTELVAISSYALTGLYSNKRNCVRAAIIYGITGTAITNFLLLAVVLIYGSYGTVNMADIALKSMNPEATTPFSGRVFGDILHSSTVALAIMTWVFLFKSGIMPNHFWLPRVYRAAPIASIILFSSSADILGVYGILRLYHIAFSCRSVIATFRQTMLSMLTPLSLTSALFSSLLTARQTTFRGIVAYSTIAQLSLALSGTVLGVPELVAGGILHMVANALGDTSVLLGYAVHAKACGKKLHILSKVLVATGLLNLFGVIPVVPGFWSKALMVWGFVEEGVLAGAVIVLISTGLCAIGYLKLILRFFHMEDVKSDLGMVAKCTTKMQWTLATVASLLIAVVIGVGLALISVPKLINIFLDLTSNSIDVLTYISNVLP